MAKKYSETYFVIGDCNGYNEFELYSEAVTLEQAKKTAKSLSISKEDRVFIVKPVFKAEPSEIVLEEV